MKKRLVIYISIFILLIVLGILIFNKIASTGKSIDSIGIYAEPLKDSERQKVLSLLESSEIVEDIPKNNPIAIQFFRFENGKRIWQEAFLVADGEILEKGNPTISLTLHSKYLPEFDTKDFCTVIQEANKNRDLGFYSKESKTSLLWKYKSLLKYKECIGI